MNKVLLLLCIIVTVYYCYCVLLLLCIIVTVYYCYCVLLLLCIIVTVYYCYCVLLLLYIIYLLKGVTSAAFIFSTHLSKKENANWKNKK